MPEPRDMVPSPRAAIELLDGVRRAARLRHSHHSRGSSMTFSPGRLIVIGGLVLATAFSTSTAHGSIQHPSVVNANPANFTPNVVPGGGVTAPSVDALAQIGSTMYAGGLFSTVQNSTRTTNYTRNNLMSFNATTGADQLRSRRTSTARSSPWHRHRQLAVRRRLLHPGQRRRPTRHRQDRRHHRRRRHRLQRQPQRRRPGDPAGQRPAASSAASSARSCWRSTRPPAPTPATSTSRSPARSPTNAGTTDVYRFAVNPAGTRLVAIGNFTDRRRPDPVARVHARPRRRLGDPQRLVLPAAGQHVPGRKRCRRTCATSTSLPTAATSSSCRPASCPFSGGVGRDLCDAASRFETNTLAPYRPTWINYTGGDTFHSVAATGAAVYVQGHFRCARQPHTAPIGRTPVVAATGHRRDRPGRPARAARGTPARPAASAARTSWPRRPDCGSPVTARDRRRVPQQHRLHAALN